jgi:DNA-binding CsgD family transcriptional regulator
MHAEPRSVSEFQRQIQVYGRPRPDSMLETLRDLTRRQLREAHDRIGASRAIIGGQNGHPRLEALLARSSVVALRHDARLLLILERLLTLEVDDVSVAMHQAAEWLVEALSADKVDFFVFDACQDLLVARVTSDTPMGRLQRTSGLERLPSAHAGLVGRVFRTDQSALVEHADEAFDEVPLVVERLGVRSAAATPFDLPDGQSGVLAAWSVTPCAFAAGDLTYLETVARWLALACLRLAPGGTQAARPLAVATRDGVQDLTDRQLEVAALIRQGLTNAQIATHLSLDPGTVANHVANILTRLGFRSRTQVAVWATERGLEPPADHQVAS